MRRERNNTAILRHTLGVQLLLSSNTTLQNVGVLSYYFSLQNAIPPEIVVQPNKHFCEHWIFFKSGADSILKLNFLKTMFFSDMTLCRYQGRDAFASARSSARYPRITRRRRTRDLCCIILWFAVVTRDTRIFSVEIFAFLFFLFRPPFTYTLYRPACVVIVLRVRARRGGGSLFLQTFTGKHRSKVFVYIAYARCVAE